MYNDNTLLTFGKYKFSALCRVPAEYLLNLYEKKYPDPKLLDYIERNLEILKAKQEGKIPYPEINIDVKLTGRTGNTFVLVCKDSGKIIFENQKAARYEIKRISNREQDNKKPTREYECEKCGGWHITSMPYETWEKVKKNI